MKTPMKKRKFDGRDYERENKLDKASFMGYYRRPARTVEELACLPAGHKSIRRQKS